MPIIHVHMYPRDVEMRRDIAKKLTEAMVESAKVNADQVRLIFHENDRDMCAHAGELMLDKEKK